MRVIGALLLTLSAVTPASSVFIGAPDVIAKAGSGALLSLIGTALLVVPIAYVYAELSSAFPIAGGEYAMTGRTLGPAAGFAVLGLTVFLNMIAPALLALGVAPYLAGVVPGLDPTLTAVAVILVTTAMGVLHIRTNAWVTGAFLFLELLALGVLAWLGFSHLERPIGELLTHPVVAQDQGLRPAPLELIGLSASISVFVYNGFGGAVYFAEEMHEAPRLVARTILLSGAITVAVVLVPIAAVLLGAPDLRALIASSTPFDDFIRLRGGRALEIAVGLSVALAIVNAALATILQNGRFFFSTGRDAAWHPLIDQAFLATHPRFKSPWVATLAAGASALAMCFLGLDRLLLLTGAGLLITYAALCIAALAGRATRTSRAAVCRAPLHPLMPLLGLAGSLWLLFEAWLDPASGRPSLIASLAVIALSLLWYVLVVRRRGAWTIRDPEDGLSGEA
jgi:amino acid transporter